MSRISLKHTPAAVCDNCGRSCCTLDQAGIPCYHCNVGRFVHRKYWVFWECPGCHGRDNWCEFCNRKGFIATPREDFPG